MTRRQQLLDALHPVFSSIGASSVDVNRKNAAGKIAKDDAVYEAFLYSLVLDALENLGFGPAAVPTRRAFRFRRAPGRLVSTPARFSYVEFTTSNDEYELHCDTKVVTRSAGAVLEVDIVVIKKVHANRCRQMHQDPSYRRVHFVLEAKYHSDGIGTVEAKSFSGICERIRVSKCGNALVTCGKISQNAQLLLAGVKPPILSFENVSALKGHAAGVAAFIKSVKTQLSSVC